MLGTMMDVPLLVSGILRHAEAYHGDAEVVSATMEGGLHRYTYADLARRSRQLASALARMGLETGDRVGTLAWNDYRHMELYYSVSGSGFVCHTINPRLFREQIAYIIEHAGDSVLFFDLTFLPVIEELADQLNGLKAVVAMTDTAHMPESDILAQKLPDLKCYETLIDGEQDSFDWPSFDENTASGLCYTSGTTGDPKGVLYSHRSSVLHAMAITAPDALGLSANDVVCPIVPMFHVNAWGLPFAVPMVGAKLVLPGARLDGASLYALFEAEGVSSTAGVPTVWLGLLDWMDGHAKEFTSLKRVIIGGSAVPAIMISRFHHKGVEVRQAWGMTETSPLGLSAALKPKHRLLPAEDRLALECKQGRPVFGMEFRVVGGEGREVTHDGRSFGSMLVRGPWVAAAYFNAAAGSAHEQYPGWFDTGDVVTIDKDGFIQIVDRTKDVVKSGGEWISSIDLENIAQAHPAIKEAAIVARPDTRWGERPVLVAVLKPGAEFSRAEMRAHYKGKTSKWCVPDDLIIVDELPHTATGKLSKKDIRQIVLEDPRTFSSEWRT
ncbi:MAG: long-chain fatty acid--CoA ligase [Hyphomonas sp.]|jgi:fatty-acyl-CoA synthase|uniref:3-methylmercaptopropionyl-CoA ligase n=1 Tax=Sphingopyxis fribergensis TaxID=1515612 RepID=A0A0A7PUI3_9SPHN|nr:MULTISPECIES: long-chain-fatty-acid--CoA ligase [Alphaproteobacteria]MAF63035.1 long-chain fatty acid--CoA ligase [Blastomonas sp.]MBA4172099.1 long-chain fatty acid--CoA ligase [Hyphomicrobium sp.]AJA11747.1 Medium-chain-fatty-acid-CoA ligase [Sphingopyxis fribergensis]MBA4228578.1 long-chain fatty acid--CoA ligase [Hyphomonas sp.]MCW1384633.1 long-chain-fatty-acid--CoA ligase [Novosphingobium sp. KCTC 2891]|tara:strand:+ start:29329 stop:30987 length:1659 start_codon:yes stop_codon:yes gene_type:complete